MWHAGGWGDRANFNFRARLVCGSSLGVAPSHGRHAYWGSSPRLNRSTAALARGQRTRNFSSMFVVMW